MKLSELLAWALKYWIEILFTIVVTAGAWFWKKFLKMWKNEKQAEQKEFYEQIEKKIQDEIQKTQQQSKEDDKVLSDNITKLTDAVSILTTGLLSVQGKGFKETCREYLKDDHILTLKEYEALASDHRAYKALGGNHDGDDLWSFIEIKAENTFGKK